MGLLSAVFAAITLLGWIAKRLGFRMRYLQLLGIAFPIALHGSHAIKTFSLALGNYFLAHWTAGTRYAPFALWTFNLAVLFSNELLDRQGFGWIHPILQDVDVIFPWWGFVPRWQIFFKVTVLRMLSFGIDLHKSYEMSHLQREHFRHVSRLQKHITFH